MDNNIYNRIKYLLSDKIPSKILIIIYIIE